MTSVKLTEKGGQYRLIRSNRPVNQWLCMKINMMTENNRRALLELMYRVILYARAKAWGCSRFRDRLSGQNEAEIADLMDVIHNIPVFLHNSDGWNDDFFKTSFLDAHDHKWANKGGIKLLAIYEGLLSGKDKSAWLKPKDQELAQPANPPFSENLSGSPQG
jgi:hypothetical protein